MAPPAAAARDYGAFLAAKAPTVASVGFDGIQLGEYLFPFQRDIVRWALRRGRAALFSDCGLGKTISQLEWARCICTRTGGNVLILAPLAVTHQTVREATRFGIEARYCRKQEASAPGITVTNYEMLDRFDPGAFVGVVIDESSILKSYDGKTRTAIIEAFANTPYRLACTATPAPNDFMELGNHAEFLGAMSRAEMLAMFFVHDGGSTQDWRLKAHAEEAFWQWICRWAVTLRRPSDLGYSDEGFVLPPLRIHEHTVSVDHRAAWHKQGTLFALDASTLMEQRAARRETIDARVARCVKIVRATPGQWLLWCELNAEADALEKALRFDGALQIAGTDPMDVKESRMGAFVEGTIRTLITKGSIAGHGMNFQNCHNIAYVGLGHSYEMFYQTTRRCWRFGQKEPVDAHVITAETETRVVANLKRKEAAARKMADSMLDHAREIQRAEVYGLARDVTDYQPSESIRLPMWLTSGD